MAQDSPLVQIVDRAFAREAKHTNEEIAERVGLPPADVAAARAALGLATPQGREYDDADLERAQRLKALLDTGVPLERVVELNRVIGRSVAQIAAASRTMLIDTLIDPEADEEKTAARMGEIVPTLAPLMEPVLGSVYADHVRQLIRSELVAGIDLGARDVFVGFADLVGFTRLGEQRAAEDLGRVASRLEEVAAEHVRAPAQVVKTIGDAVMLVAPSAEPMLDATLALAAVEEEELPQLRIGIAHGPALERAGDWYGRPVNLASRISDIARPGTVVVTSEVREAADEGRFDFSSLRPRRLKGVGVARLFRAKPGKEEG